MESEESRNRRCPLIEPDRRVAIGKCKREPQRRRANRATQLLTDLSERHGQLQNPARLAERGQSAAKDALRIIDRIGQA